MLFLLLGAGYKLYIDKSFGAWLLRVLLYTLTLGLLAIYDLVKLPGYVRNENNEIAIELLSKLSQLETCKKTR